MSIESVSDLPSPSAAKAASETTPESGIGVEPQSTNLDDLIRVLKNGSCPSLTGQSTLTYQFGANDESVLYMRLIGNSGGGIFSNEWISCSLLEQFVSNKTELTSGSFKALFPNKSVNTGGFIMAVLRSLGLLQVSEVNSRWHEHVVGRTLEQLAIEEVGQEGETKKMDGPKSKRKSKEA